MVIVDTLIFKSLLWVLDKIARAVDAEMGDDATLREELLAAQMREELGELNPEEYRRLEAEILRRLNEIRRAREGPPVGVQTFIPGVLKLEVGESSPMTGGVTYRPLPPAGRRRAAKPQPRSARKRRR